MSNEQQGVEPGRLGRPERVDWIPRNAPDTSRQGAAEYPSRLDPLDHPSTAVQLQPNATIGFARMMIYVPLGVIALIKLAARFVRRRRSA